MDDLEVATLLRDRKIGIEVLILRVPHLRHNAHIRVTHQRLP